MNLPKRHDHLSWKRLGDFTLILDSTGHNKAHQLNEIGSVIWEYCDGQHHKRELLKSLLELYETDIETLEKDVDDYLSFLLEKDLVSK